MNQRIKHINERPDEPADAAVNGDDADLSPDNRYGRDEVTGLEYVKARPGQRMVTSEEIYKELEEFP